MTTTNTTQKEMVANLNDFRTKNGKKALTNCKASKAQITEWIKAERLEFMKSVAAKTHLTAYIDARTTYYHRLLG